jgi:peptidoglycan/xylan/chitin deacetylase (PgdA/CDA1 family)
MTEPAILLTDVASAEIGKIGKVLRFFGVEPRAANLNELASDVSGLNGSASRDGSGSPSHQFERYRLLCSSDDFVHLVGRIHQSPETLQWWRESVHSAFVYAGADFEALDTVTKSLTRESNKAVEELASVPTEFEVTNQLADFTGAMAGVRISSSINTDCYVFRSFDGESVDIVSTKRGAILIKSNYHQVPIFLCGASKVIDLDATLPNGLFDIRNHLPAALPIVLYTKWAFADTCWHFSSTNACFVIDDPPLKPQYGFVNFDELLSLMRRHRFTTSLAFIPWNSRRSAPEAVKLFKDNHYSISVHGCDHGRAEFGSDDLLRLYAKSSRALERMTDHEFRTGLAYDPVMVFPQGVFSKTAVTAIKHAGFIAAVNNDTINVGPDPSAIRIKDVWDVAVMKYDDFPIFTRRYPWEGIENFAFDALLGKPVIAVVHHEYCSDGCERLADFVDGLNRLNCSITWRSLADLVKRSYRHRTISGDSTVIEMYATELFLENNSNRPITYFVRRRGKDSSVIEEIRTESERIEWRQEDDAVFFDVQLKPRQSTTVSIRFRDFTANTSQQESLPCKAKTAVRRHLCELRDNYWHTSKHRVAGLFGRAAQRPAVRHGESVGWGIGNQRIEIERQVAAVERALSNFVDWLGRYGEISRDHQSFFAGPIGGRAKSLYYRYRPVGTAAVAPMIFAEAFVPSARRLFHHPTRFPIADAHYAMGFGYLYETTNNSVYLERAIHFLNELKKSRCLGFKEYCWGYPFDWVWRGGVIKQQTPLITTTPYCYEAFAQVAELLGAQRSAVSGSQGANFTAGGREDFLNRPREAGDSVLVKTGASSILSHPNLLDDYRVIIDSIARHAATDIKDFKTSESASSCSYTPNDEGGVINAAAYRAFLLTNASQVFSNEDYRRIAERNLNFVLESQNQDGSWFYAVDGVRDFVDHYHTCFVMKALAKVHGLTGHEGCLKALSKGVDYYLGNLFAEDGLPKPFSKAPRMTVYKRELYDSAECINLCLLLRDRFPQLQQTLDDVVKGVLRGWVKPDGSFRSRRLHVGWDNVPMHRWGQSQMFRALAFYLRETSASDVSRLRQGYVAQTGRRLVGVDNK